MYPPSVKLVVRAEWIGGATGGARRQELCGSKLDLLGLLVKNHVYYKG